MAERVFAMPDPGEGLADGRIVEWLVVAGDVVTLNQPIVEVETAKAAVEIPSPYAGTIVALHGEVGDDIPVGAPLLTFEVEGVEPAPTPATTPEVTSSAAPVRAPASVKATPPVRRLAKELGVDLAAVPGSGPDGRVTEADVRRQTEDGTGGDPVRREIARVLTRQAAIPQVTTFRTLDCTELDALRRELDVSPLPIVIAAIGRVLADHPLLNARWVDDGVEAREDIHVGLAVDTEQGLMVPVVRDAARRGIGDLAGEIARVAAAARSGAVPTELGGAATFAVSNTGSYGSEAGTPILSPGTSATLAVGVIAPRALVVDGEVVARPACTLSLTFDHRVLDGAAAGRFLTDLVAIVQSRDGLRDLPR